METNHGDDASSGDVELDLTAESHDPASRDATGAPPRIGAPARNPSDEDFVVEWQMAGTTAR